MCNFFSWVTEPEMHGGQRFYFDWEYRKKHLNDNDADSHDHIEKFFKLPVDKCNKYEYNPLTKVFGIDQINSPIDDRFQAEEWVNKLDFKKIVEPLVIKEIINPLELKMVSKPTKAQIALLKDWDSVRASVRASVWDSVRASVWASVRASARDSVWDSVRDSVWDSVRASVWDSVWDSVEYSVWASVRDSVWAYVSTFVIADYQYDFSPSNRLWESGLVPSFDGKIWRLHSGENAKIVYEITAEKLRKEEE